MTNTGRFELAPLELRRLSERWREQEHDLRSAAALLDQGPGSLPTPVLPGVRHFFAAWATEIEDRGVESRAIANALDAVAGSAQQADQSWGSAARWPWAG